MCTSIMAGIEATDPEMILLARNEDFERNNWDKYMVFRPFPEYHNVNKSNPIVDGNTWTLGNGLKVDVPEKAFSYSAIPDSFGYEEATYAIGNRFYFEERGINQKNVAMSATNSMEDINCKVKALDPFNPIGIEEAIIPTLILPQAETAIDAVQLMGHYIQLYGASEGNGILIGDPTESWYFEIGSGYHWVAVKVPKDAYLAVANGLRVHDVDLDSQDVLYSDGLFKFVTKNNLLEKPDRNCFNFAGAFGEPGDPYNVDRIWLAQKILTPSLHQKPRQDQYPLFLKPDKKIQVEDVMTVMRATYKGTELESCAERPIGVDRTAESHIITLNPKMPDELKGVIWQAIGTPMGAPYMPLYNVMKDIPPSYSLGSNQYSPISAYWSFRGLYSLGYFDDEKFIPDIRKFWNNYEQQFLNEHEYLNDMLIEMYQSAPETAIDFAKKYSTGIAYQSIGMANNKRNNLMTIITNDERK